VVLMNRDGGSGRLSFSIARVAGVEEAQNYTAFARAQSERSAPSARDVGTFGELLRQKLGVAAVAVKVTAAPVAVKTVAMPAAPAVSPKVSEATARTSSASTPNPGPKANIGSKFGVGPRTKR
jgi:hypothetical protein